MAYLNAFKMHLAFPCSPWQYEEHGEDFVYMLDGMFSFVLLDTRDKSFIAARDAIGITPLYMGWGLDGRSYLDVMTQNIFKNS